MRVIGQPKGDLGEELDIKRFYIPGVILEVDCPQCGQTLQQDLEHDYLSFPSLDKPETVYFYCDECGLEEIEGQIVLHLSIEAVE